MFHGITVVMIVAILVLSKFMPVNHCDDITYRDALFDQVMC